ncbi:MAG: hypothetical protein JWL83_1847 [Actinomycetia bacterium]|nr:hypothetical protein [Actinomycetes bacterium]
MKPRARAVLVFICVLGIFATAACSSSSSAGAKAGPAIGGPSATTSATKAIDDGARTRITSSDRRLTLETSSARAAFVSGGDVLVTVSGPASTTAVRVTRNGDDVSSAFAAAGTRTRGVVTGLRNGANTITAQSGTSRAQLTVTNHPIDGPMVSGPHITPWVCTTQQLGLGAPTNANCDAPTKTTWSYRANDGSVKPLPDPTARPADLGRVTVNGVSVPFIIRAEQGVIDRGVYWIWVLDPNAGAAAAWRPTGWNERLVYRFGGGCGTQYSQGNTLAVGLDADLLARGYALATNTLDTFQTACNDVLSAEAAMMTREHFVEAYGVPRFTIGDGGSGGAIQQLLMAYNYPGVLDALSPEVPFPDAVSIAAGVTDCGLLVHYYKNTSFGASLNDAQRRAINGHASSTTCEMWDRLFVGGVNPTDGCDASIPAAQIYNAQTNRKGVRCTLQDESIGVLGRDPKTGFARRPLDNTGVQYGLRALNDGTITADQFLDVNQYIGGYDIDGNVVPQREQMDRQTAALVYRSGRVDQGGPLADVPIILRNVDTDALGDIHTRVHPFAIRDRLQVGGKDDPNLLLWTTPASGGDLVSVLLGNIGAANAPIVLLDQWLSNLAKTNPKDSMPARLAAAKPGAATNQCVLPDGKVLTGGWELYDAPGPCRDAYPVHADPRLAAGEARRGDIVKCALKAIDDHDYKVKFSAAQRARRTTIFPNGVCDWAKPGVGQQPAGGVWQTFGN